MAHATTAPVVVVQGYGSAGDGGAGIFLFLLRRLHIDRQTDVLQSAGRKGRSVGVRFMRVGRRDQHGLATGPHRDALLAGIEGSRRLDTPRSLGAKRVRAAR